MWGSALAPNGFLYYFNRESRETRWSMPPELEKDINEGKLAKDRTEPVHDCEFLHISLQQCEKTSMAETGCNLQRQKFLRCLRQRR